MFVTDSGEDDTDLFVTSDPGLDLEGVLPSTSNHREDNYRPSLKKSLGFLNSQAKATSWASSKPR